MINTSYREYKMAEQQIINIGTLPNDGEGDPLRVAFGKINNNFSNLFATAVSTSTASTTGNTPGQVIFQTSANTFTSGQLSVYSSTVDTQNSQSIQISVQVTPDKSSVKFSGYGTTIQGNALVNYNMDVFAGNVRLLINPLVNEPLVHLVGSQAVTVVS